MVLAHEPSTDLAAFAVWVPELGAQRSDTPAGMSLVTDPRVRHYWDQAEVLGRAYGASLPTPGPAWDVYLLFRRGVRWTGAAPPKPDFWMHQLGGVTAAPRLDPAVFRDHVERLLKASTISI